jgi:hypothetical protein
MEKKEHLTESGLNRILAIKFSFKYGANSIEGAPKPTRGLGALNW